MLFKNSYEEKCEPFNDLNASMLRNYLNFKYAKLLRISSEDCF